MEPPAWLRWQGWTGVAGVAQIVAVGMALWSLWQARQATESSRHTLVEPRFVADYGRPFTPPQSSFGSGGNRIWHELHLRNEGLGSAEKCKAESNPEQKVSGLQEIFSWQDWVPAHQELILYLGFEPGWQGRQWEGEIWLKYADVMGWSYCVTIQLTIPAVGKSVSKGKTGEIKVSAPQRRSGPKKLSCRWLRPW